MMQIYNKLTVSYAVSEFGKGKAGTCALVKCDDGSVYFAGLGIMQRRVLKLWMKVGDQCYDEQTFNSYIIMRKSHIAKERPAWLVIADKNYQELYNSENSKQPICCIAIIDLSKKDIENCADSNLAKTPFCLRAEFNPNCAEVVLVQDPGIFRMWITEGNAMYAEAHCDVKTEAAFTSQSPESNPGITDDPVTSTAASSEQQETYTSHYWQSI